MPRQRAPSPSLLLLAVATTTAFLMARVPLAYGVGGPLPSLVPLCSSTPSPCVNQPLRVGSWNLQRFGVKKVDKPEVVHVIGQVVRSFDLLVLSEVTDRSGTAIPALMAEVNAGLQQGEQYVAVESPRIGRTSYKEQYVFVFKPSQVTYVSGYQFNDTTDRFQVEPFVGTFSSVVTGPLLQFTVIPLHAKPSDAVAELDALVDVYDDMVNRTDISDSILLGDFNAGCNYVVQGEYEQMRLHTQDRFHWLISDHADTTTRTTSCPYDRIIIAGPAMLAASYDSTASPYYFDEALGIQANWSLVEDISDHYPVGVLLKGTVPAAAAAAYPPAGGNLRVSVVSELPLVACWAPVHALVQGMAEPECDACQATLTPGPLVVSLSHFVFAEWSPGTVDAAGALLLQLAQDGPQVITDEAVAVLGYKAGHGGLTDPSLYAPDSEPQDVRLSLLCRDEAGQAKCDLTLSSATRIN